MIFDDKDHSVGDCGRRAFTAGLLYAGVTEFDLPPLPQTDDLRAMAEVYGLTFIWKGQALQAGNNPVLVVYRCDGEGADDEYHAVFASDQAPFARWPVHSAITGWEELRHRVAAGMRHNPSPSR